MRLPYRLARQGLHLTHASSVTISASMLRPATRTRAMVTGQAESPWARAPAIEIQHAAAHPEAIAS
jgi:hypothetical protein